MSNGASVTTPPGHLDPVCGMSVDPANAAGSFDYRGRTYYFYNPSCLERFKANPAAFVDGGEPLKTSGAALMKVEYTCPMHPQIVRDQPGACPICGMALEPRMVG